jgi:hypothetical protein
LRLFEEIGPYLAGRHPNVIARLIAGLLSWLLAGCAPNERDAMRKRVIDATNALLPVIIDHNIEIGRLPSEWRKPN